MRFSELFSIRPEFLLIQIGRGNVEQGDHCCARPTGVAQSNAFQDSLVRR
jgi:hypothetical protein